MEFWGWHDISVVVATFYGGEEKGYTDDSACDELEQT